MTTAPKSSPKPAPRSKSTARRAAEGRQGAGEVGRVGSLVNVGYGNLVSSARVVAVVVPGSSPMRRLRERAGAEGLLIDATEGRRTRSILILDSHHVVLSAINPETIQARLESDPGEVTA